MISTRFHRIEYCKERGLAVHARRISKVNPPRKNATGLCPNHDLGQRMAPKYRKIPNAMTDKFKPRSKGSLKFFMTTKIMGTIAKTKWRFSGIKVVSASTNV